MSHNPSCLYRNLLPETFLVCMSCILVFFWYQKLGSSRILLYSVPEIWNHMTQMYFWYWSPTFVYVIINKCQVFIIQYLLIYCINLLEWTSEKLHINFLLIHFLRSFVMKYQRHQNCLVPVSPVSGVIVLDPSFWYKIQIPDAGVENLDCLPWTQVTKY